jgi:hypothetical protein
MAENTGTITAAERIEEIEAEYGVEITVTGGGKGWTAEAVDDEGIILRVKADSKMGVLSLLDNSLQEQESTGEAEADEDEDGCSEECQNANPNSPCTCKCGGRNHPGNDVVVFGPKPCRCGCGEITKRRFVAGHDARFHFAERARALGLTADALRANLKRERNAKSAAARKAKRAALKAAAPAVEAAVAKIAVAAGVEAKAKTARTRKVTKPVDGEEGPESLKALLVLK